MGIKKVTEEEILKTYIIFKVDYEINNFIDGAVRKLQEIGVDDESTQQVEESEHKDQNMPQNVE